MFVELLTPKTDDKKFYPVVFNFILMSYFPN